MEQLYFTTLKLIKCRPTRRFKIKTVTDWWVHVGYKLINIRWLYAYNKYFPKTKSDNSIYLAPEKSLAPILADTTVHATIAEDRTLSVKRLPRWAR